MGKNGGVNITNTQNAVVMDPVIAFYVIVILLVMHVLWVAFLIEQTPVPLSYIDIIADSSTLNTGDILMFRNCVKCHHNGDALNDVCQDIYRTLFNTARYYFIGEYYTHVAIILRGVNPLDLEQPYICHIDGGDAMYDALLQKKMRHKVVVSPLNHINVRNGQVHLYRRRISTIPPIVSDLTEFIKDARLITYPENLITLVARNALRIGRHNPGTQACTDFIEHTMIRLGMIREASNPSTMSDILTHIHTAAYNPLPITVVNRCYLAGH